MGTTAFLYCAAAGALGVVISLTYMKTGKVSVNFARTLVILPILICVVMQAVNGSLGTSVAILGAFSLIRFRSLQGSSRDIAFIFFSMTVGIICSIGYLVFAVGITVFVCAILFFLNMIHYAQRKVPVKDLRITIPENLDYSDIFEDIFENYLKKWELIRVKTTNMGSLYELEYRIEIKEAVKEKEMLDDIRTRNGNLNIVCGRCELEYEEL
ncbi:MAG: DUF4956 domain-containing protein [Lachnospiraceae bacterium]